MPKYTGKDMSIKFGTTNISAQGRSLEVGQTADEIETTGYGDSEKTYIAGKTERQVTLEVMDDSTSTTVRTALTPGSASSLTWFPIGTVSGNPKFSFATATVIENNLSYPYDDVVLMSVTIRGSSPLVESTASASGT